MLNFGTNLVLAGQSSTKDPVRGKRNVVIYEGTLEAINLLIPLISPLASWEVDGSDTPKYRITISSPDNTDLQTVWELQGNDLSKSIWEHGRTSIDTTEDDRKKIKGYIEGDKNTLTDPTPTLSGDVAKELLRLLKVDTTHYFLPQYVLRVRMVGSNAGFPGVVIHMSNVGLIFKQEDIIAGGVFDLQIDAAIQSRMAEIEPPDARVNYTVGWLFKSPTITGIPGGKFELRQKWWFEQWANYLYDLAVP